jgi:PAS domain S-box-containing protein
LPQTDADLNGRAATDVATRPADDINRRIVDSSEDCLKILNLDGRIDYVNSAGVRHMELTSPAGIVGRYWIDFWELEAREAAQEALASAKAGRRGVFQGPSRTATGFAKWWDVAVTPITDADGTVVQLLVVARDLTERRREEAFRAGQHDVLEMIASGAGLDDILGRLVHLIERAVRSDPVFRRARRSGGHAHVAWRRAQHAGFVHVGHGSGHDRSARGLLRYRHLSRQTSHRGRCPLGSPLGRNPRSGAGVRVPRLLVGSDPVVSPQGARFVCHVR